MTDASLTASGTLQRFGPTHGLSEVAVALDRDGAVIVEGLLSADVIARVNDEVEGAIDAADPDGPMFNPMAKAFMGSFTKNVPGVPGISRTFAIEVMCHRVLLDLADQVLGPHCARFQLNLGQILQRGPGSEDQWLHRDEGVWSDVPKPSPELQLASVIALVDFTGDNGATRLVPGSHRWPDRHLGMENQATPTPDQISYCLGWLRTEENNFLSIPPAVAAALPREAQEVLGYSVYDGISRGGGYLGMVRMQDPVELLARDEL